jgi:hypothetical protein
LTRAEVRAIFYIKVLRYEIYCRQISNAVEALLAIAILISLIILIRQLVLLGPVILARSAAASPPLVGKRLTGVVDASETSTKAGRTLVMFLHPAVTSVRRASDFIDAWWTPHAAGVFAW